MEVYGKDRAQSVIRSGLIMVFCVALFGNKSPPSAVMAWKLRDKIFGFLHALLPPA
jgi:hypothetical protein